jgi:putative aldouronate transport system substrate-binding protein
MLKDTVPGINIRAIAPPNGKEYTIREEAIINGAAISAGSEKKEIAIKFLDFIFSEEGGRFMNFGVEGQQYDMVDGKPIFRDEVIHGEMTAINILERVGACTRMPYRQDFWYEEQWLNEAAKEGARMYIDNGYLQEPFPVLSYTPEEKTRLNEIMTQIKTLVQENTQKWVFGSQSIADTYDNYIMRMQNMGLEEATKIQQAAYDRYLNK